MSASATSISLGEYVTFSGYLRDTTSNIPLSGKRVVLRGEAGAGASDTTDSSGHYSIRVRPSKGYYYVEFEGDSAYKPCTSRSSTAPLGVYINAPDRSPPGTPTMYSEPAYTRGTTNTVSWSAVPDYPIGLGEGVWYYEVQCSPSPSFPTGTATAQTTSTSYTFTGLSDGVKYYYRVRARDRAGNWGGWSNVISSTQDATAPPAPLNLSSQTHPSSDIWYANPNPTFTWAAPSDLSGIQGYSYALNSLPDERVDSTQTSVTLSGVAPGEHTFYVRALDGSGNWSPAASCRFRVASPALIRSHYAGFFLEGVSIPNSYEFVPPAGLSISKVEFSMGGQSFTDSSAAGGWRSGDFDMGAVGLNPTLVVKAYSSGGLVGEYHFYPEILDTPAWLSYLVERWGTLSSKQVGGKLYWVWEVNADPGQLTVPAAEIPVGFISGALSLESLDLGFDFTLSSDGTATFEGPAYSRDFSFGIAEGSVEVSFTGDIKVESGTVRWREARLKVNGEVVGTYSVKYPIMVIGYMEWGIRVYAEADLDFVFGPGIQGFQLLPGIYLTKIEGSVSGGAEVYGAAGVFFVAHVEAGGGAKLTATFEALPSPRLKSFKGYAYLYGKVSFLSDWIHWEKKARQEWRIFSPLEYSENVGDWELEERRPLGQEFVWAQGSENGDFIEDVLSIPGVDIAVDPEGNMMMVWIHDSGRAEREKTSEIYYSYYDATANRWSEPRPLTSNDLLDIRPSVVFLGDGRAVAVWHQIPHEFTLDEEIQPFDVIKELELVYSVWDPVTKSWSPSRQITANSGLDTSPVLVSASGQAMLVYVSDPDGNPLTFQNNSIFCSRWEGDGWSDPEPVVQNASVVERPALAVNEQGNALLVFVRDMDGTTTFADRELYSVEYADGEWGEPTRLTDDSRQDSHPSVAWVDGSWYLTWIKENHREGRDAVLAREFKDPADPVEVVEVENMMLYSQELLGSYRGNLYLIYQAGENNVPRLLRYDGSEWVIVKVLAPSDGYCEEVSAEMRNGYLGAVMPRAQLDWKTEVSETRIQFPRSLAASAWFADNTSASVRIPESEVAGSVGINGGRYTIKAHPVQEDTSLSVLVNGVVIATHSVGAGDPIELSENIPAEKLSAEDANALSVISSSPIVGQVTFEVVTLRSETQVGIDIRRVRTRTDVYLSMPDIVPPSPPKLFSPANESTTTDTTPTLEWLPQTNRSGILCYDVELDDDSDFISPEEEWRGLVQTLVTSKALLDGLYYWRVRAIDGAGNVGDWSEAWSFIIDTTPPPVPTPISPEPGATTDNTPEFSWTSVTDPSGVTYDLQISNDPTFPENWLSGWRWRRPVEISENDMWGDVEILR